MPYSKDFRQSTAATIPMGPFLDINGNVLDGSLGLAASDVKISKAGGAQAAIHSSTAPTYDANGVWLITLDTTDTNSIGLIFIIVNKTGAMIDWITGNVISGAVYDVINGSTALSTFAAGGNVVATNMIADPATNIGLIKTQTDKFNFDGSNNVKSVKNATDTAGTDFSATEKTALTTAATAATPTVTVSTNNDKTGYTGTATNMVTDVSANVASIKAKTDNLPSSPAAVGSQMDLVNAPNATALTAIATAVWAATTRTLSSFGALVSQVAAAILATPTHLLATNSDGSVNGSGGGGGSGASASDIWGYSSRTLTSSGAGSGINAISFITHDGSSVRIAAVLVAIYNATGNLVATATTDSNGSATVNLDAGSFTAKFFKSLYTFANYSFTSANGLTITETGTLISPSVPTAGTQTVYVQLDDPALNLDTSSVLWAVSKLPGQALAGNVVLSGSSIEAIIANGQFEMQLAVGGIFRIRAKQPDTGAVFYDKTITITSDSTKALTSYT